MDTGPRWIATGSICGKVNVMSGYFAARPQGRGPCRAMAERRGDEQGAGHALPVLKARCPAGIIAAMHAPAPHTIEQLYYGRHRLAFQAGTYLALIRMMGIGHLVTALYGHTQLLTQTQARLARTRATLRDLICNDFDSP